MNLVKQIHIDKKHPFYKECDELCFASKNLYNYANYLVKKQYEKDGTYLNYYAINKILIKEKQNDYIALPRKVSNQTLMKLDTNYKSFFKALNSYNKNSKNFTGKPQIPKFKHKTKGRNIVIYELQTLSIKELKKGIIHPSKTNIKIENKEKLNIKQVTITPTNLGDYNINLIYEKKELPQVDSEIYAGVDMGLNNLAAVAINNCNTFLINGKPLKSINQYYNKKKADLQSKLPFYKNKEGNKTQRKSSKRIQKLTRKRNNKIKDYLHKASKKMVTELKQNNVSKVIFGHNEGWKQEINIGKKNNQNFVSIPHQKFIEICTYKLTLEGIEFLEREESYTSKCSFLDNEIIRKHNNYKGHRVKRGLFVSEKGIKINADINGAFNILKKEIPNAFANGIEGITVYPRKLSF